MINFFKKIWAWVKKQAKKIAVILGIGAVAMAASLIQQEINPLFIDLDGQIITFPYTDDNTNETLLIRTNQQEFPIYFGNAVVYFAITNNSGKEQDITSPFSLKDNKEIISIEEYLGTTTLTIAIEPYISTSTGKIVSSRTITQTIWGNKALSKFDITKVESSVLSDRKDIKEATTKGGISFILANNQTRYFKAVIKTQDVKKEEFFIEALGEDAYGHLDPWTFEDKFNSDTKSIGDLNGQDGWSSGLARCYATDTAAAIFEGDQGIACVVNADSGTTYQNTTGVSATSGIVYTTMKAITTGLANNEFKFFIRDSVPSPCWSWGFRNVAGTPQAFFRSFGAYDYFDTNVTVGDWYQVAVDFDEVKSWARYMYRKQASTTWSGWSATSSEVVACNGTVSRIDFTAETDWAADIDIISPNDPNSTSSPAGFVRPPQILIIQEE